MYIAVLQYKHRSRYIPADKVCVLDTEDCSVEVVHYFDLHKSGVVLLNQERLRLNYIAVSLFLRDNKDSYLSYNSGILKIGDMLISRSNSGGFLCFNKHETKIPANFVIAYPFLFRGWVILRLVQNPIKKGNKFGWYTVAIKDDRIEYWGEDFELCTDKSLAVLIDTVSEV